MRYHFYELMRNKLATKFIETIFVEFQQNKIFVLELVLKFMAVEFLYLVDVV